LYKKLQTANKRVYEVIMLLVTLTRNYVNNKDSSFFAMQDSSFV